MTTDTATDRLDDIAAAEHDALTAAAEVAADAQAAEAEETAGQAD